MTRKPRYPVQLKTKKTHARLLKLAEEFAKEQGVKITVGEMVEILIETAWAQTHPEKKPKMSQREEDNIIYEEHR